MPLPAYLRRTIYTLTILGWLVVVVAATPYGDWVDFDLGRLAVLTAVIGSLKWLVRRMHAPAHELFVAGKMAGRAEALAERDPDVVRLDDRRALRLVFGERSAAGQP